MDERLQTPKPVSRVTVAGVCVCVAALVAGMEVQKQREERPAPDPTSFPVPAASPEARLAAIQLGRPQLWRGSTVKRLESLLDLLAADCPADTRRSLAGLTTRSLRELAGKGISATPTQVLGGVVGLEDVGRLPGCASYFARYVAERESAGS